MFVAGFDHTQKIRVCGENPLPHPALPVANEPDSSALQSNGRG